MANNVGVDRGKLGGESQPVLGRLHRLIFGGRHLHDHAVAGVFSQGKLGGEVELLGLRSVNGGIELCLFARIGALASASALAASAASSVAFLVAASVASSARAARIGALESWLASNSARSLPRFSSSSSGATRRED
ncbi:MAG: hypothetical protein H2172_12365 [Opitutus sp.]|nr:hypothetical protein [Opitutus sp.]